MAEQAASYIDDVQNTVSEEEVKFNPNLPGSSTGTVKKNTKGKIIHSGQKIIIYNIYFKYRNEEKLSKTSAVKSTVSDTGISRASVWKIVSEMELTGSVSSPPKHRERKNFYEKLDEDQHNTIRYIVHSFFLRNEPPTLAKVLAAVQENETLPLMGKTSLWHILRKMGFKYEKKGKHPLLVDRPEIILWRRRYINKINTFR
ncbi:hypothetical protein ABEB36_012956 [Hypothenemus hampei]|uniref:Winged helix-turn helix domain-containing protein n=1 Tax=Hypothenemus hampei TaxID=57062 RepID=A0ABD1EAT8_HYPHA